LAVEEVGGVLAALRVVAEDLHTADVQIADAAVGGVKHGEPARNPFVDVAGDDLRAGRVRYCHGLALVDPLADEHLEPGVLGARLRSRVLECSRMGYLCHGSSSFCYQRTFACLT
jgi:hypothetical protein